MDSNNAVRRAVRLALMTGTATAIAMSPQAQAQEAAGAGELEEITVTGTRIKKRDLTAISPVKSVTQEDFKLGASMKLCLCPLVGNPAFYLTASNRGCFSGRNTAGPSALVSVSPPSWILAIVYSFHSLIACIDIALLSP